jgi:aspartate kinase
VEGVYTADPRVVSAARLLEAISYDEMLELAAHGARVLHAEAVEFARRSDIALYARATGGTGAGTRIDRTGDRAGGGAAGVTGQKQLVLLRVSGEAAATRMLDAVEAAKLSILHLEMAAPTQGESAGEDACSQLWFALDDVPDWDRVRAELLREVGEALAIEEECGAVSIVGERLGASASAVARARRTVADRGVGLLGTASSPMRLTIFCAQKDVDSLVEALHAQFCEQ